VEVRTLTSTIGLNRYLQWPGVKQVCRVQRVRRLGDRQTTETVYYMTSLSTDRAKPDRLLELIRDHWGVIENGLHYVRDEALGEDRSTIRTGDAPQNLAALRNGVLNWLRRNDYTQITPTLRNFARNPLRLLAEFGYPN
jgi:predicted transposase YbfD/YdcC